MCRVHTTFEPNPLKKLLPCRVQRGVGERGSAAYLDLFTARRAFHLFLQNLDVPRPAIIAVQPKRLLALFVTTPRPDERLPVDLVCAYYARPLALRRPAAPPAVSRHSAGKFALSLMTCTISPGWWSKLGSKANILKVEFVARLGLSSCRPALLKGSVR